MKLLMHICCGPCGTHCITEAKKEHEVTLFWFNPNIHPASEHEKRLDNAQIVAGRLGVPMIEVDFDPREWLSEIKGYETEPEGGKRCLICFGHRLKETAKYASENGFDAITTTMTVSPLKDAEKINSVGERYAKEFGVKWLYSDYKKDGGFEKSIKISKEMELYRQRFCGCFYSRRMGEQ